MAKNLENHLFEDSAMRVLERNQAGKPIRVIPDGHYALQVESPDFFDVMDAARSLGWHPDRCRQTYGSGYAGHLRLKKDGEDSRARLTSEVAPGQPPDREQPDVLWRLYIPVAAE